MCLICTSAQEFMGLCTGNFFSPESQSLFPLLKACFFGVLKIV